MRAPLVLVIALVGCLGTFVATRLVAQRPQATSPPSGGTNLVDMSAIMKNSTRFNQAMDRLKQQYEAQSTTLKEKGRQIGQRTEELRKMPPTDPRRKQLEQDLMKQKADLELDGKKVTGEIRDTESRIILGLMGDLKGQLDRYARANRVQIILRNDPTPPNLTDPRMILQEIHKPIVYQRGLDVTPAILESLNRGTTPAAAAPRTGRAPAPAQRTR